MAKENSGRFKKGFIPWNKGKTGYMGANKGSFKKGIIPKNKVKVGTITIRVMREGDIRRWIKIEEPNNWRLYSNYLWGQHNGKIPKGMIIHHKDRDKLNDKIENYEVQSRAQHLKEHREEIRNGTRYTGTN